MAVCTRLSRSSIYRTNNGLLTRAQVNLMPAVEKEAEGPVRDLVVSPARMAVIGHRGMGKNNLSDKSLRIHTSILENTILSFQEAGDSGADFVEFDIQVTSDGHPVIFHDDFVLTSDGDRKKVSELTLEEFLGVGKAGKSLLRKLKSGEAPQPWVVDRQAPLCSLADAFQSLDESLGFNVEVKFVGEQSEDVSREEIERILDPIFKVVEEFCGSRKLFFSTFHPDAAILLKQRQSTWPVFFLTDGGSTLFNDKRMNSIPAAIDLCVKYNLEGIVSEVKAILFDPTYSQKVKSANLQLLTYGEKNNHADALLLQHEYGVDGVIVDHVYEAAELLKK